MRFHAHPHALAGPKRRELNKWLADRLTAVSVCVRPAPWGRPQADGPAIRATAMMKFARIIGLDDPFVRSFLYHANLDGRSLIKDDLEWLAHNWQSSSFDRTSCPPGRMWSMS